MKFKKTLKIVTGIVIFFTLPTLLLFGFLYFKYNEDLPQGAQGEQADVLARKMLFALNQEAYESTSYLEWTFKKRHHFKWNKAENKCEVFWKKYKVNLDLNNLSKSEAFLNTIKLSRLESQEIIEKAINYFNNDSFWLVAPYKIFDPGTERRLITLENGEQALLVTYKSGGSTPGDSYLWLLDKDYKPKSFKMWTSILPIDGLEASWSHWIETESGAQLPLFHEFLFFGLEMGDVKGSK